MTTPAPDWASSEYGLAALLLGQFTEAVKDGPNGAMDLSVVHPGLKTPGYVELGAGAGDGIDLAWTRVVGTDPVEANRPETPGTPRAVWVNLELGVWRCYPIPENNAMPPLPQLDSLARGQIDDAARMRDAIHAVGTITRLRLYPGPWRPLATSGGLYGSSMTVRTQTYLTCYPNDVIPPIQP